MKDKKEIEKRLWGLHEALIDHFLEILKNKEQTPKGSSLDVMRAFLKDNAISRAEMNKASPLDAIGDILEDWSAEESPESDERSTDASDDDGFKFAQ